MTPQPLDGVTITGENRPPQLLGSPTQLIDVGTLGERVRGHEHLLPSLSWPAAGD
jgi:hypothetical protein